MYVFIRSCIALTRGVVKIIQTDPDSFFSSRSGTLSSTAAPTYHVSFSLSLFISTASFVVIVSSLLSRSLAIVPMPNWRTRRSSISRSMTSLPSYINSAIRGSPVIAGYSREIGTTKRSEASVCVCLCVEDACRSLRKYNQCGRCRNAKTCIPMFKSLGYLFLYSSRLASNSAIIDINFIRLQK